MPRAARSSADDVTKECLLPVDDLTAELMGTFPTLPYLHAIQILNRAWTRVRDTRLWSWQLIADAEIFAPAVICCGCVTVRYQETTVEVDETAAKALNAICGKDPPIAGELGIGRQIKIGAAPGPDFKHPRYNQGVRWNDCPSGIWGCGPWPYPTQNAPEPPPVPVPPPGGFPEYDMRFKYDNGYLWLDGPWPMPTPNPPIPVPPVGTPVYDLMFLWDRGNHWQPGLWPSPSPSPPNPPITPIPGWQPSKYDRGFFYNRDSWWNPVGPQTLARPARIIRPPRIIEPQFAIAAPRAEVLAPQPVVASTSTPPCPDVSPLGPRPPVYANAYSGSVPYYMQPPCGGQPCVPAVRAATPLGPFNGPNYTIVAWDGISKLTIDKPFGEPSVVGAPYWIYKAYYVAPAYPATAIPPMQPGYDNNLIRFMSLTNKASGYTIRGKKLWYTQEMLNAVDPQRGATGDAYILASYGRNAIGLPVFELYPHPVSPATYYVTYWTRWPDVNSNFDFPAVPYGLTTAVMDLARVFASQWASANVATKPELQLTNWVASAQFYKQEYKEGLIQCIKQDDEISPLRGFTQTSKFDFPLGGQFLQGHDVTSLIGVP